MKQILLNFALALASVSLNFGIAKAETFNLGEIELGKPYNIALYQNYTGTITAPSTGTLYQYGGSDATYDGKESTYCGYCDNGQLWSFPVEKGKKYSVELNFASPGNDGTITWNMQGEQPFEVKDINPVEGAIVASNVNNAGDVLVTMSEPWTFSKAYIVCESVESESQSCASSQLTQGIRIGDWMKEFYANGTFKPEGGTAFSLKIEDIKNSEGKLLNESGLLEIGYIAAPKTLDLQSTNIVNGSQFLSYYPLGDPAGIFTLTFDGDLNSERVPVISIGAGNVEAENAYYYEEVAGVVNGASVTFDLTGVNRRPGFEKYNVSNGADVELKVKGVYDTMGNMATGGGYGQVGSYSFSLIYKVVKEDIIDYEFTPISGSFISNLETINIWMSNIGCIESFDGILFEYTDGTSDLIPYSQLHNVAASSAELEYDVAIPEKAKSMPVTVSVSNIVSSDGYDKIIKATYNQMVVYWCNAFVEGESYVKIPAGDRISVNTNITEKNFPEISVLNITIRNLSVNHDAIVFTSSMQRDDKDGYFVCDGPDKDIALIDGCVYSVEFVPEKYDIYPYSINIFGGSVAEEFSNVLFVEAMPEIGATISNFNTEFELLFDGLVTIMANDEYTGWRINDGDKVQPFVNVSSEGEYGKKWTVAVPEEALTGKRIILSIRAYDENGMLISGNVDDPMRIEFSYAISESSNIDILKDKDGEYEVYRLNGNRVFTTNDKADLNALSPGLYIINDVKVLIK